MPRFDAPTPGPADRPAPGPAAPHAAGQTATSAVWSWSARLAGPWPDQPTVYGHRPGPSGYAGFTPPVRPRMADVPVPRLLLTAAVAAGVGCAAAIPTDRAGIGWPVAFLVVAAAVLAVGWRTPGASRALLAGAPRWETAAWGAAALS